MKKVMLLVALAGAFAMTAQVFAGGSCCPSSKKKAAVKSDSCSKALSGIELTDDQKGEIAKIEAECKEAGWTKEACSKSMVQIREVLTEDQKTKFDAAANKAGCDS